jgi:hypothetical protein
MFAIPTDENVNEMSMACQQGDLCAVQRLYEQVFKTKNWGYPGSESEFVDEFEHEATIFDEGHPQWQKQWLLMAAFENHVHILKWFLETWNDGYYAIEEEDEDAIASGYIQRLISPQGTVEDALRACGKGWWRTNELPYLQKSCYEMEMWFNNSSRRYKEGTMIMSQVPDYFRITGEVNATLFTHTTPEHVRRVLEEHRWQNNLVSTIIGFALDVYTDYPSEHNPDPENGSRLFKIAEELLDMGFEFTDDLFDWMDIHADAYFDDVWRLMRKMLRIRGGKEVVRQRMTQYDKRARARASIAILFCVAKLLVSASRACKRTWEPQSIHVVPYAINFAHLQGKCTKRRAQECPF